MLTAAATSCARARASSTVSPAAIATALKETAMTEAYRLSEQADLTFRNGKRSATGH